MENKNPSEDQRKKITFFLGCVVPIKIPYIEKLARDLFDTMGFEVVDLGFTCCPTSSFKDIDEKDWLIGAARNLALAEKEGIPIVSLCNGCSQTLIEAHHILSDKEKRQEINAALEKFDVSYGGKAKVYHFLMFFDENRETLANNIKKPLKGFRFATHTGCHLLRPSRIIGYDSPEDPKKFDDFIRFLGAMPIDYDSKPLCCGYTQITNDKDVSLKLMKGKLDELAEKDIDGLAVCCPSCYLHYDKNQVLLKAKYKVAYKIPVFHALQLLGLSFGLSTDEVFLKENRSLTQEIKDRLEKWN